MVSEYTVQYVHYDRHWLPSFDMIVIIHGMNAVVLYQRNKMIFLFLSFTEMYTSFVYHSLVLIVTKIIFLYINLLLLCDAVFT